MSIKFIGAGPSVREAQFDEYSTHNYRGCNYSRLFHHNSTTGQCRYRLRRRILVCLDLEDCFG